MYRDIDDIIDEQFKIKMEQAAAGDMARAWYYSISSPHDDAEQSRRRSLLDDFLAEFENNAS